ncbi:hypothetical protein BHE90_007453 [Fusarium euwallaceae]|uniref:Uncharacterized protein n=2 Tax=Fusarium solani species complex TaxID=232080 RepID=A0A3M2SAA6_9HYPO|nr:hypothetical protein CDV36_005822 [Fusarium kuroshium]RTE78078.1 hypothetical protein BHE90_007453 [Fusarium euwallaceae]
MFDVIWTDPNRELVGEHRARKEKKREQKQKQKESIDRRSQSVHSGRSSSDHPFGFLLGRASKKDKNSIRSKESNPAASQRNSGFSGDVSNAELQATRAKRSSGQEVERPETSKFVQPLGPASYVTKQTEVSYIPRTSGSENHDLSSEVCISSEGEPVTPPEEDRTFFPAPLLRSDSPANVIPGVRFAARTKVPMMITFKSNGADNWRPPEEWACLSEEENSDDMKTPTQALYLESQDIGTDLDTLHREVKRMAAANASVVLSRIKEVWSTVDESLHGEVVLEKKRWMLSTLLHLDPIPQSPVRSLPPSRDTSAKILALYESQAMASYLAALYPSKKIYHLSATPLSNAKFPNVNPVLVPSVSPSAFPVAPNLFESVYSVSLPSLCPSPDIPAVLKNINKCLRQGGSLHLMLIDPLPCAKVLGIRMRTWLEEHLLFNLERNFRCTNPSKLFGDWMGEACLRGYGSTIKSTKFYAVPESVMRNRSSMESSDPFIDRVRDDNEVKAELRCLVGRMLWMEVWGDYVLGDTWWWEDEECVRECLELGTFWEYKMIEGFKDGDI